MSVGHYENFPVASVLVPARYRSAVVAIYRFARAADDIADEGNAPAAERHRALEAFSDNLDAIERGGTPADPPFAALAPAVREHRLPIGLLRDLLSAFAQDVDVTRYATFADVLDYCRRSANPVGRLLLAMYRVDDACALAESDAICTALQLANFWQDVSVDHGKGRIYLPLESLQRFGVTEDDIAQRRFSPAFRELMRFEVERARDYFNRGLPLIDQIRPELALDIELFSRGGQEILNAIEAQDFNVLKSRPAISKPKKLMLVLRAAARKVTA